MRSIIAFLAFFVPLVLTDVALAQPPASDPVEPAIGSTFRVTVDPQWSGTGLAISREGWVVTTADLIRRCPAEPAPCGIWVEDPGRQIWLRASLIATDPGTGVALLRTAGRLPAAATLASREVRPGEAVHASGFDGNDRRSLTGSISGERLVTMFGDPPASGRVVVTTLECPDGSYGTGLFATRDETMVGMVIGSVVSGEDADAGRTVAMPSAAIRAFYDLHRTAYERRARAERRHRR